ncbi:inositol-3-phosphate synthase [Actinomycetospora cinnamomea]|uniref:Myo-inositol-1-phosphate synthase n=1 Tax=Actinomycetospora cinnamomea TaxID=663609 RepID=A0A2U1FDA4_9PSEU|nr:inositol-3-phosphate synthase [Actinomycetospora cinnamomea]PVZ09940.1 myo-inositol-1-phosphate synthase [Actinomycetospora cinnamomea]
MAGAARTGVAIVGLGGAVATTAVAGVEMMKLGAMGRDGLPFADAEGLVPYTSMVFAGWDVDGDDLAKAAHGHRVLDPRQIEVVGPALAGIEPWPAVADPEYCRNARGNNLVAVAALRDRVAHIAEDLRRFRVEQDLDHLVVVNLASTERWPNLTLPALATVEGFEKALDVDDAAITPGMVYAYAAITEGCPYINFTPSAAADVPALQELAVARGVPVAGKDGKTGQTMMKTVLAPAFRSRALTVDGWYSTNILGNRDGEILDDPASLSSKVNTKGSVLDDILGYKVDDHVVRIDYYRPRGDEKEAWDNIDLVGFLGQKMQVKVDFMCRDSVLAAPLVLELVRLVVEAQRRGEGGAQEQLGYFFKAPVTRDGSRPEHALHVQEKVLREWIGAGAP